MLDELGDDLWRIDERDRVPMIKATQVGEAIKEAGPTEVLVGQPVLDTWQDQPPRSYGSALPGNVA
jgi:hypothetical protein